MIRRSHSATLMVENQDAAILLPSAFFLSVASSNATKPTGLIYLVYVEAASLAVGLMVLGAGVIWSGRTPRDAKGTAQAERVGR